MPELPEVETTRRGIAPYICHQRVVDVVVRQPRLRWPIPADLGQLWVGQTVNRVDRRAKYLLLASDGGTAIIHLGMSGSLRILTHAQPPGSHDHVDVTFTSGSVLRLTDPRRFGALLWTCAPVQEHPLLRALGPEPLSADFSPNHLFDASRGRRGAVKNFIMDGHVVVGVGNIYASEALYRAGIHPLRAAGRVSKVRYHRLQQCIRDTLSAAIEAGGTTLRDFVDGDGQPGYFGQSLAVYGRGGEPCPGCQKPISQRVIGQRASFYCSACQR
ncbi:MAG: bifunctional DNA-formamidopyrimidine glycosylase/DNA-(apurinic or apyrimidinic site) lyase [Lysobacterales bacterium]